MRGTNEHLIQLPLRISWPKNKRGELSWFSLNLNEYRNAHHRILHTAKLAYEELAMKLVKNLPRMEKAEIEYRLFLGSARKADLANICSIVDKFFCDALVKAGVLPDDNIEVITNVRFRFGGVDRDNPRVDAIIKPPHEDKETEPMKITVEASEIETIVRAYINDQIVLKDGQDMSVSAEADGSYTVDIPVGGSNAPAPAPKGPIKRKAAPAPAPTPAPSPAKAQISTGEPREEVAADEPPFDVDEKVQPIIVKEDTPAPVEKPKVEAQAPTGQTTGRSLFGGLKPPVNS